MTIGPYHCDRSLMSPVAVAGLLSVLVAGLDMKNSMFIILKMLYFCYRFFRICKWCHDVLS